MLYINLRSSGRRGKVGEKEKGCPCYANGDVATLHGIAMHHGRHAATTSFLEMTTLMKARNLDGTAAWAVWISSPVQLNGCDDLLTSSQGHQKESPGEKQVRPRKLW
jgi:hypothetical protein